MITPSFFVLYYNNSLHPVKKFKEMKMKKKNLVSIIILVICFLAGYSENTTNQHEIRTFNNFPIISNLIHEKITTEANLYMPVGLLLLDSFLITLDLKADTFFNVFSVPDLKHQGGFITRGPGPEEEILIYPYMSKVSGNTFLYNNVTSVKTATFNKKKNALEIITKIELPPEIMDMWYILKLGDSIIGNKMSQNRKNNREFIGYDLKEKTIFDFGCEYPRVEKKIKDPLQNNQNFGKACVLKPDGSAIAVVYDKFPFLRIYTTTGEIKHEVRLNNGQSFPYALFDENSSDGFDEVMQNYRWIKSSNHYIYALYIGKKSKELPMGLNDFSNEIHVWDWDGEPVKKILLDEIIFTFDVDLDDTCLIASSLNSLNALYKYNL